MGSTKGEVARRERRHMEGNQLAKLAIERARKTEQLIVRVEDVASVAQTFLYALLIIDRHGQSDGGTESWKRVVRMYQHALEQYVQTGEMPEGFTDQ